jgi:hypothetical protein
MPGFRDAKYSIDPVKYRNNWDDIFGKKETEPKEKDEKKDNDNEKHSHTPR